MSVLSTKTLKGGLAGAAALAAGSQAYGAIQAIPLPADIPGDTALSGTSVPFTSRPVDANGDAITDLAFGFQTFTSGNWFGGFGVVTPGQPVGYVSGVYAYTSRLAAGTTIGPGSGFAPTNTYTTLASRFGANNYGAFRAPNTRGFLGFRFNIGANSHFGWMEVEVGRLEGIKFFGGAYEDAPNTPIGAGVIPEPASLGLLAVGAAAALRRRNRA